MSRRCYWCGFMSERADDLGVLLAELVRWGDEATQFTHGDAVIAFDKAMARARAALEGEGMR